MSEPLTITIDGKEIPAEPGQTIMRAAESAGIYIPRLCYHPDLTPYGSCRVCTVLVNGRPQAACTTPVAAGMVVDNSGEEVTALRRAIIDMLFVEGNHFCMFCEKSGNCELQAIAYRLGIMAPQYPFQFPQRDVDATHPDVMIDRNRCILCARCIRASRELDGKSVFQFAGRGKDKHIAVNASAGLSGTDAAAVDRAVAICPVGAIIRKRVGFSVPIGKRLYDSEPIGSDIEAGGANQDRGAV